MSEKVTDWDELYPGRFFKAGTLGESKRTLTITAVDLEELEGDQGKKQKGVLSFKEDKQQLPLNKTNGICLREMFGRQVQTWVGKRFTVFVTDWKGDPTIRVWGSPDIEADMEITISLPRKKPFKMTMHADGKATKPKGEAKARESIGARCNELLKQMGFASTPEALMDIEADMATETFTDHENGLLTRALSKRRGQLATA